MFDRAPKSNELRRVMNTCLPGLENRPDFDRDVLRKVRGDVKVKKKLSVGFVLLIVLVLAVATALAAITLNAFYEKAIQKEGESGLIQDWSAEDQVTLVDWMADAGIELDADKVAQLQDTSLSEEEKSALAMEIITDYYPARDGILSTVDIIAKEKGPIEYWSLEDKAWFSELMLQYQPDEIISVSLLPDEADISQEEAIEIMYAYYKEIYGLERDDFDESKMSISFSENTWDDGSGAERIKTWGFSVWLKNDTEHPMNIHILPNGEVKQASGPYVSNWRDEWNVEYQDFWTIEGMVAMQEKWKPKAEEILATGDTPYQSMSHLLTLNFAIESDKSIPREQSKKIADAAAIAALNVSEEYFQKYYDARQAYIINDEGKGRYFYWYVSSVETRNLSEAEKESFQQLAVYVDSETGEIIDIFSTNGKAFDQIL